MAKFEPLETPTPRYTPDQLRAIVRAGMSVAEARMLLDDGYTPEVALEIAMEQAAAERQRIAEANTARASETAVAVERATNPSNKRHPGKSAMSYPEGDIARPRPSIPYALFWNGYPQDKFQEELSWMELEMFTGLHTNEDGTVVRVNRGLVPGVYDCMEKDGRTAHKVKVRATMDADNRIERVDVEFAVMREKKDHISPLFVWLYQMVHADTMTPRESWMKGMLEYVDLTFKDEEAKRPVSVAV
jgi:hypothetical protein